MSEEVTPIFEVRDLSFCYTLETRRLEVLSHLNLKILPGEFVGIQGPSGSGKSTLFYILGFLLKATSGKVFFDGKNITASSVDELTVIRNRRIGFIFQQFHLLPNLNCLKNILLPTLYPSEITDSGKDKKKKDYEKAHELAKKLGLSDHLSHRPNQLSGGQQQRVAIARALMHDIDLILADEPTGNLDSKTAAEIMELLSELNRQGKTIILITHDAAVAQYCSIVYHLKDGCFVSRVENRSAHAPNLIPAKKLNPVLKPHLSPNGWKKLIKSALPLALDNLLRNKVKSTLTMLGVVIGVAAVLSMITLGLFTKTRLLETYEALGVNKLIIRGYQNWNLRATDRVGLSFDGFEWEKDLKPLRRIFSEIKYITPVYQIGQNNVTAGGRTISNVAETLGINPEFMPISNRELLAGHQINPFHIENRSPVCVVGYDIASQLFSHSSALGQMINVTDNWKLSYACRIIGVLTPNSSTRDSVPPNLQIFLPYTYFQTIAPNWWFRKAHTAALQVHRDHDVEITGQKIKAYFGSKYGKSGVFNMDSDSALIAQMRKFLGIFTVLITSIAMITLLVGGIGINNMMLVSVSERIKEFGLRKALGATNRSIRFQVLLESITICSLAGIFGLLLGFTSYEILIYLAARFVPTLQFEWVVIPGAMALSLFSIAAVGALSGLVPAIRAEKLQIIEALRTE